MTEAVTQPEVLEMFGLNGKLFLAQLVNVGVILFVVARWVYRPLLKVMDERDRKINAGLRHAEEAKQLRAQAESQAQALVHTAHAEARTILETAKADASKERKQTLEQTASEIERKQQEAREQLAREQAAMVTAAKRELAGVVMLAAEKLVGSGIEVEHAIAEAEQRL